MPSISCSAAEQIAQPPGAVAFAVAVAVDGLAEERDFFAAFAGELPRLRPGSRAGGRLCSGPRTLGTMQYVQNLSQPIMIRTYAWYGVGRIAGSRSGSKLSWLRSICVAAAVLAAEADFHPLRARRALARISRTSAGTWCNWPGPTTRSTYGARLKMSP